MRFAFATATRPPFREMERPEITIQHLISLPNRMAGRFAELEHRSGSDWYAGHDPAGVPLGSGGGTAHVLAKAWESQGKGQSWETWLRAGQKLVIHAGGQSRRLPAYAATGKALMPFPVFRWGRGQRLEQTLLDVQLPDYRRVMRHAGGAYAAMLASGDVLLRFGRELPEFPQVDVLGLGMWTTPEEARHFGVFFVPRKTPQELAFFLQKPNPDTITAVASEHLFLVDTGMWLLSQRAVEVLMEKCGWDSTRHCFGSGRAQPYEFYGEFALGLGTRPTTADAQVGALTSGVLALPQPEFYHFGTSRQMIESVAALQNRELDQTRLGPITNAWHPDQFVQNSRVAVGIHREENRTLWIENSTVPATWRLCREHVITGAPDNAWILSLEAGNCLDFVPVGADRWCVRFYGIDDRFAGHPERDATTLLGQPLKSWFRSRHLTPGDLGSDTASAADIQTLPLFPVVAIEEVDGRFIEWLLRSTPEPDGRSEALWRNSPRLSARALPEAIDLDRLYLQRSGLRSDALQSMLSHRRWSVFYRLDLAQTAAVFAETKEELPAPLPAAGGDELDRVHDAMFRAAVMRHRADERHTDEERRAFGILRDVIVRDAHLHKVDPKRSLLPDQIVWARSPVRFDLAGGWTDTPPYCLEHGGQVVNVAVDLNGQPPMQVFAKLSERPEILLRSIDLGEEERVDSFESLERYAEPGKPFALSKAAFALAGFLPRFHADGRFDSLRQQLEDFGGGIELTLLSAVPKGSGLGTSSILAATVLAALSEVCGLGWDRHALFGRTLALEQMITTGGGWQDQAGGVFGGIKLIETQPGIRQEPRIRWLPDTVFSGETARRRLLLYYTGITRMAKGILAEIVRGIFLNSPEHLAILDEIRESAYTATMAIERCDFDALGESIRRTWSLKQRLDRGTNPPEIQSLIERAGSDLVAATLPGAGGGGYLLMLARDEDAAFRIRRRFLESPAHRCARFVDFRVSNAGLQVSRS